MDDGIEFDKLVGSNVQTYRTAKGLSQSDLAAAMSGGGEHVHQQTIQKIEKGARPLKYAEAVRICRALGIGIAQLSDGAGHTTANAQYLQRFAILSGMRHELGEFANRLCPILVDLAESIALERSDSEENQATAHVVAHAKGWLRNNWGKDLNGLILESLRAHPHLRSLDSDVDAPTYAGVLRRASEREIRDWRPDVDDPEAGDDVSET